MKTKQKSLGKNAVLNTLKTVLTILFPILTYPYILRVLQLETFGRYKFSHSVVSYFALISALGIYAYAIREGTRLRGDRKAISRFASEMFSINIYSTAFSYCLLTIAFFLIPKLFPYRMLMSILAVEILLTAFSLNWLYVIYEDYSFLLIISMICQMLALAALFLFVRRPSDVGRYAAITVLSNYGFGAVSLFYSRKYISLRFVPKPESRHFKPILTIFLTAIAATIYINSDITILGWIKGDYATGIYGTASQIYLIVKQVLNATVAVMIPRMTDMIQNHDKEQVEAFGGKVFNFTLAICLPALTGVFCISPELIKVVLGSSYLPVVKPLRILSIALIFAVLANFFANCVLISLRKEKIVMTATVIGALLNIVLNLVLIPVWGESAAAFTTLLAESCVFGIAFITSRRYLVIRLSLKNIFVTIAGCTTIAIACMVIRRLPSQEAVKLIIMIAAGAAAYVTVQLLWGDRSILDMMRKNGK